MPVTHGKLRAARPLSLWRLDVVSVCLVQLFLFEWEEEAPGARAEKGLTLRKGKHPLGISSSIEIVETRLFPSANSEALGL